MFNNLTKGCQDLVSGLCEGHHSGGLGPIYLGIGCTSVGVKDALKIARQRAWRVFSPWVGSL